MAKIIRKGYILELNADDKKAAKEELSEDPKQTASHVATLKAAVRQAGHMTSREDDFFFLMFLRQAKFSQMRAREVLENFIKNRLMDPYQVIYTNRAVMDPKVERLIKEAICFGLPSVSGSGVRLIMSRPGAFDPKTMAFPDFMKACMMNLEIALLDPVTQVHGVTYVLDYTNVSLGVFTQYTPTNLQVAAAGFMNTLPARFKGMHLYNAPRIIGAAVMLLKTFLSKKAGDRIHTHADSKTLLGALDKSVLPDELGGTAGTYKELASKWYDHVQKNLSMFEKYSTISYDASKAPAGKATGTFRKLNND